MSLRDASGNILNKTEFTALTAPVAVVPPDRVLSAPVYEHYPLSGEGTHEMGKRLRFKSGTRLTQSQIDALYNSASVASVAPSTGPAAGGTAVTITGTNLSGVESVTFDGIAATNLVIERGDKITCVSPPHAAGVVNVVVADDAGDVTVPGAFTYV